MAKLPSAVHYVNINNVVAVLTHDYPNATQLLCFIENPLNKDGDQVVIWTIDFGNFRGITLDPFVHTRVHRGFSLQVSPSVVVDLLLAVMLIRVDGASDTKWSTLRRELIRFSLKPRPRHT